MAERSEGMTAKNYAAELERRGYAHEAEEVRRAVRRARAWGSETNEQAMALSVLGSARFDRLFPNDFAEEPSA